MQHHAYLYRAPAVSKQTALPLLSLLVASEIEYVLLDTFGIEDVRSLTEIAYRTPSVGERLGVVVVVQTITVEAEQALLKLLEEPPHTTVFLFCVPESVFLLPTLLSRFTTVAATIVREQTTEFRDFLSMTFAARIGLISSKLTAKDLSWQYAMREGLVAYLYVYTAENQSKNLATLYYVAEHLLTRGASNKQLLEELAFTLPFAESPVNGTL